MARLKPGTRVKITDEGFGVITRYVGKGQYLVSVPGVRGRSEIYVPQERLTVWIPDTETEI